MSNRPDSNAPAVKTGRTPSWQDGVNDATPKRAQFYTALRTDAYINQNMVENYLEFWAAFRVDAKTDKWRVMHYMMFDMNLADGKFVAEKVTDSDVGFMEAVGHLARSEYLSDKMLTRIEDNVETLYPAAKYPELRVHYHDLTHYKDAANVEGVAFDEYNDPYRRVEGKIFSDATFKRSEVAASILAAEQTQDPALKNRMEAGLLSEIFSTSSARLGTLDAVIKMGECLSVMDDFAVGIAAFYLGVQKMTGRAASFDAVEGLTADEKKAVLTKAKEWRNDTYGNLIKLVSTQNAHLHEAKHLGVHTEPFEKFLAECEVYLHMLNASLQLPQLEQSMYSASNADVDAIIRIKESVERAAAKFISLGGTEEQMDRIKAWIANQDKEQVPGWLPGFLTRYYTARGKVMAKVQARNAQARDVATMPAEVKPALTDDRPKALPEPETETLEASEPSAAPAEDGKLDIERLRRVAEAPKSAPKPR